MKPDEILAAPRDSKLEKIKEHSVVLALQDTTELNFTHHPQKTGLGYLDSPLARGLKVHSVLCSSVQGTPLGLLQQQVWARDWAALGKKHQRGGGQAERRWLRRSVVRPEYERPGRQQHSVYIDSTLKFSQRINNLFQG